MFSKCLKHNVRKESVNVKRKLGGGREHGNSKNKSKEALLWKDTKYHRKKTKCLHGNISSVSYKSVEILVNNKSK